MLPSLLHHHHPQLAGGDSASLTKRSHFHFHFHFHGRAAFSDDKDLYHNETLVQELRASGKNCEGTLTNHYPCNQFVLRRMENKRLAAALAV